MRPAICCVKNMKNRVRQTREQMKNCAWKIVREKLREVVREKLREKIIIA